MIRRSSLKGALNLWLLLFFGLFLAFPLGKVCLTAWSLISKGELTSLTAILDQRWQQAFCNSLGYSLAATMISTVLGFLLAYGSNFTQIGSRYLKFCREILLLPMLLPTITYGYILIYGFGKQGFWSRILQQEWFTIYGRIGLLLGLVIYTLPPIFLLIDNGMQYLDTRTCVVSRLLGDNLLKSFYQTIFQPLTRILAVAFLQGFFMAFTDFGIPSAVGGQIPFITTLLYEGFMGTIPNFPAGSLIALTMLLPSVFSILLLHRMQKQVVRYEHHRSVAVRKNKLRDIFYRSLSGSMALALLLIFLPLFIIPFIADWPFDLRPSWQPIKFFLDDQDLVITLKNSLLMALSAALTGTFCAYLAAILSTRRSHQTLNSRIIDSLAIVTNSIPGMVLGIAYLLLFSGTALHNTLALLVIVTVVHYFSTPYQMAKEALQKLNLNWEYTARLMGDSWGKTIWRILLPNSRQTLIDMFAYYFCNGMVTISGVIFLTSTNTMVVTAKLKELQHFGKFNQIFLLSLFLLLINGSMQLLTQRIKRRITKNDTKTISSTTDRSDKFAAFKRLRQRS